MAINKAKALQENLINNLNALIDSTTKSDPESPLRWTYKSTRILANELKAQGNNVSHMTVATLLRELDYKLAIRQKNTRELSKRRQGRAI